MFSKMHAVMLRRGCALTRANGKRIKSSLATHSEGSSSYAKIVPLSHNPNTQDFFERKWVQPSSDSGMVETLSSGKSKTTWKQLPLMKDPVSMVQYQALLAKLQPKTIFDLGECGGGAALWLADQCRALGLDTQIVTIDMPDLRPAEIKERMEQDPSIFFIEGDALEVPALAKRMQESGASLQHPWLVSEGRSLDAYPLMTQFRFAGMQAGDYLVFEDTHTKVTGVNTETQHGKYKQLCFAMTAYPKEYDIDTDIQDMFGTNGGLMANSILRQVEPPAETVKATVSYSCAETLEAAKDQIAAALRQHGQCLLRYEGAETDAAAISKLVPAISKSLGVVSPVTEVEYPAAGGTDARPAVSAEGSSGLLATDFPPHSHIPPHHELLFTPNRPERAGFVALSMAEQGGETTVFDGVKALQVLEQAAESCDAQNTLRFRVRIGDRIVYRRVVSPPSSETSDKITNWGPLFGEVSAEEALRQAGDMGFEAELLASGDLQLDFSHSLVCSMTGALNSNACEKAHVSYDLFYRDGSLPSHEKLWWASDGEAVTDEETMLMQAAYAQAKVFFKWNSPGDAILLDNRRMAHGRMPYHGGNRQVAVLMGNTE